MLAALVALGAALPASAALVVTNGDFEADAVSNNSEGSTVDVTSWFESTPTGGWVEWLKDSDGLGGGAGNNWGALSGNSAGTIGDIYFHQSLGTLSPGVSDLRVTGISSDRGDRAGTGRHAAIIQLSLWYDDGSATLANGSSLDATVGLTQIGAMTVGASAGGTFSPQSGTLDIDLTTLNPVGQALAESWQMDFDLSGSGVSAGSTVYMQIRYFDSDTTNSRSEAFFDDIAIQEVPEPSIALLGGLGILGFFRRRR